MLANFGVFEEGPEDSKVTAVHAAIIHTGKVLIFHCRSYPMWTRLYDPVNNEMSGGNLVVPIWPVATEERPIEPSRIFCAGHCFMMDGKLLVAGGEKNVPYPDYFIPPNDQPFRGIDYCFIFDPLNDPPWIVPNSNNLPHQMDDGRWYPSLTVLNDGRILALGGLSSILDPYYVAQVNDIPEFYIAINGWDFFSSNTSDPTMPGDLSYYYPAGHLIPTGDYAGKIFFSTTQLLPSINPTPPPTLLYGAPGNTQLFDPDQAGSSPYWRDVGGQRQNPSQNSNHLLLPIRLGANNNSRVIVLGGWWGDVLDTVEMIDLSDPQNLTPDWTTIDPMSAPRQNHNSIILPDRKILVIGGNNDNGPCNVPELLDSDTLNWETFENETTGMDIARNYHSTALLLPNAKIFLGGGRVTDGGDVEDDTERRITIFTPYYLLDGTQPMIGNAPTEVTYGEEFSISLGDYAIDSMAFIKPMSVTHGYNSEQRYIELAFEPDINVGGYIVTVPANANIAPPGYYMFFVLKDVSESNSGESKIPSNAVFIKLSLT